MLGKSLIKAAAGNTGGEVIENLFQTWLYTGNGSTQTITNGIDLAGEGGMIWCKSRNNLGDNALFDTERGVTKALVSNTVGIEQSQPSSITDFLSDGFTTDNNGFTNVSGTTYASWTFRKAPGFFDVVTYTGTGSARTIAHNLGSVPGCIIIKRTDTTSNWAVYHRSLTASQFLLLNLPNATGSSSAYWNSVAPTSTEFTLGSAGDINASGGTYVAYLFAHDAQIFGEGGDQSVIKCGSFTTDGSGNATVNLGWEPQWILTKNTNAALDWYIADNMRGWTLTQNPQILQANLGNAEVGASATYYPTSTGFYVSGLHGANQTVIYIAIRRGPMKTPTSGTEVFDADVANDSSLITTGFPVDSFWLNSRVSFSGNTIIASRLTGLGAMTSSSTGQEVGNQFASDVFASNSGFRPNYNGSATAINYAFRRAPGFFDIVAYTGTGVARTVAHNLGVAPELMIVRWRSGGPYLSANWMIYSQPTGSSSVLIFTPEARFTGSSSWNNTSPTSAVFTVGGPTYVNDLNAAYIAYLFATLPGVSKVGSYTGTGTGTTLNIDCGFAAGARFVLIKRTDSTGDWYVWDTARGIIAANDPFLLLNSSAAENSSTDYIDPLSSGFQISSTAPAAINANGGSYIFLAIS